ncbi:YbjN domain-containing protein [Cupriavidus basilensis]|uniref:YbjN domain-containing protein n=1 Tax=Cupriavidus basilensis TaxID=68895 RepID=UPI0023E77C83|nr:YbjN domain-containing protein [Cupriavidus basilensis]
MNANPNQVEAAEDTKPALLMAATSDQVADAIKAAGCAVAAIEQDGVPRLHSASHGVGFQVLWGNSVTPGEYLDFTLSCPLRVQGGALPEGVLGDWHRAKRFARVAQHGEFLVLEMDVVISGGVGPDYLTVAMQLWMQMMGQFFLHLRNFQPAVSDAPADGQALGTGAAVPAEEETASA